MAIQTQSPQVKLKLKKPKNDKKIKWTQDTVDNEDMNKKKSKCKYCFHINVGCIVLWSFVNVFT